MPQRRHRAALHQRHAAVPEPEATLDEFVRVLKPGGELILVNHIGAESGPRRWFELAFAPIARRLGWRPESNTAPNTRS